MLRSYSRVCLALTALILPACGDDITAPAEPCTDDTGSVEVHVTNAAQPSFSWSPACAVALLIIEREGSDQWLVGTDDATWNDPEMANLIRPPVTYGAVPTGTQQSAPPEPLQAGVAYDVVLWRVLPAGSTATCMNHFDTACLLAVHEFIR